MPKKTVGRKKSLGRQALPRLQVNLKRLRSDAEALLGRARKQATQLITRDQKQAVQRLVREAQQLRADFDKRVQRASKEIETRSRRFFSTLEKEAEKRLEPIVSRLIGPSRKDVENLARRVRHLEQIAEQHRPAETPMAPSAPSLARPEAIPSSADEQN